MVRWLVSSTSQWIFVRGTQETPAFLDDGSNPEVSYKHKGGAVGLVNQLRYVQPVFESPSQNRKRLKQKEHFLQQFVDEFAGKV